MRSRTQVPFQALALAALSAASSLWSATAYPAETGISSRLDCAGVAKISKIARSKHLLRERLFILDGEIGLRTSELFTESLIRANSGMLTQADVAELRENQRKADKKDIADGLVAGYCHFFEDQTRVLARAHARFDAFFSKDIDALSREILSAKGPRTAALAKHYGTYATDAADLRARRIAELVQALSDEEAASPGEFTREQIADGISRALRAFARRMGEELPTYAYDRALKAFLQALDPHSGFLSPSQAREEAEEGNAYAGIGVSLSPTPLGPKVRYIAKNGPAGEDGTLRENDLILAVDGMPTVGQELPSVSRRIRGPEGTSVRLKVGRARSGGIVDAREIRLRRGAVASSAMRIRSSRKSIAGKSVLTVSFGEFYDGCASDLREALWIENKTQPVDALVLDLRGNPGGSLQEAIDVASLFIESGPVVARSSDWGGGGRLEIGSGDREKALYRGPLVIAVNNGSASASEIIAGSLKAYRRAVIAGGERTFGKGSWQVHSLGNPHFTVPLGGLVLTQGLFYSADGSSVQNVGVASDLVVPGPSLDPAQEERNLPNALSTHSLEAPLYDSKQYRNNQDPGLRRALAPLSASSRSRIAKDERFSAKSVGSETQLEEIQRIAADYAAARSSCVMRACGSAL
jgi:C-terminal peptidase prc